MWHLGVGTVVLTGQVTEQCVLYSALDAHIRHLDVTVPRDAVASIHPHLAAAALEMMERNMGARIVVAREVDFRGTRWPVPDGTAYQPGGRT